MRALAVVLGLVVGLLAGCGGGGGGSDSDPVYEFGLSFVQYRVFENANTGYQAYVTLTKDGRAIKEADVDDVRMYSSANNLLNPTNSGFNAETYMALNCLNGPCAPSGPIYENGFYGSFPVLPADAYDVEVDTADGQALTLKIPYPGQLALPVVMSSTMQSSWLDRDLVLSWTNPVGAANWGEVDQLRVRIFDGSGKPVVYVRLSPATETVTISSSLLNQAVGLGDGTLASWEVQARVYDANNMNFARSYSNRAVLDPRPCFGEVIDPIGLTIGTTLNDTIEPFGTKFYVFAIATQGSYAISLYNMATDNGWALYEYVSNCEDDYPDNPPVIAERNFPGTLPEFMVVPLEPKQYLLIVDEYDNQPSSYSLEVIKWEVDIPDDLPGMPKLF